MTAKVWNSAFDLLMLNEGGYVNNPNDKGGETKYGISQKAYPNIDIENLSLNQAKEIYHKDYWNRCKCDYLPDVLSVAVFDFAVNSGNKRAITYLQKCLGVTADGIIGNQTIGACNRLPVKKVLEDYIDSRLSYLQGLKDFKHFGKGWTNRVIRVKNYCEAIL